MIKAQPRPVSGTSIVQPLRLESTCDICHQAFKVHVSAAELANAKRNPFERWLLMCIMHYIGTSLGSKWYFAENDQEQIYTKKKTIVDDANKTDPFIFILVHSY